jgi:hypothetical protein
MRHSSTFTVQLDALFQTGSSLARAPIIIRVGCSH